MTILLAVVQPPAPSWLITLLQITLLVLVALGATLVVVMRQPVRQAVVLSVYGVVLAILFLSLQAPDVALSELTIGAVVLPLLLLLALAKIKGQQE